MTIHNVLILGARGLLGSYINKYLSLNSQINVVTSTRKDFDVLQCDASQILDIIKNKCTESNIHVIINCIGIVNKKENIYSFQDLFMVNSYLPFLLGQTAKDLGIHFIQPSTDGVFKGDKLGSYSNRDVSDTVSTYGMTKAITETVYATVIRTSIIGISEHYNVSLMDWVFEQKNKSIKGYTNHYWNGITCLEYAKLIEHTILIDGFWIGVKTITSTYKEQSYINKYDLCKEISNVFDLNIDIEPYNTPITCNRALQHDMNYTQKDIRTQLEELAVFHRMLYYKTTQCYNCNNTLDEIVHLGPITLAGGFQKQKFSNSLTNQLIPFSLGFCDKCKLILCREIVNPNVLFHSEYPYLSSQIKTLVKHFTEFATTLKERYNKGKVLEIGCNDGVFLYPLIKEGFEVVGVDPSDLIKDAPFKVYTGFVEDLYDTIIQEQGVFDIITASNCLAHTKNIKTIFQTVSKLLRTGGSLYIEVHYGTSVFTENQFDFLYHEHMIYYTINAFHQLALENSLTLWDVEFTKIHGTSIRVCIKNQVTDAPQKVLNILEHERQAMNQLTPSYFIEKSRLFTTYKQTLRSLYNKYNTLDYVQYAYGASGRANTICSYCDLTFTYFIDDAPSKIGMYTPYYNTLIRSSDALHEPNEEGVTKVAWIMAWPYAEYIISKHRDFKGIFIVPDFKTLSYSTVIQ